MSGKWIAIERPPAVANLGPGAVIIGAVTGNN
jgi:hypothetical protein